MLRKVIYRSSFYKIWEKVGLTDPPNSWENSKHVCFKGKIKETATVLQTKVRSTC